MSFFKKMLTSLKSFKFSKIEKENLSKTNESNKPSSFTKKVIGFVLINSELQIWASYVLAFLGKDAIAEALSQQIVSTIVGTIIGYFAKSLIENLSKYTTLFGKNVECNGEDKKLDDINNLSDNSTSN